MWVTSLLLKLTTIYQLSEPRTDPKYYCKLRMSSNNYGNDTVRMGLTGQFMITSLWRFLILSLLAALVLGSYSLWQLPFPVAAWKFFSFSGEPLCDLSWWKFCKTWKQNKNNENYSSIYSSWWDTVSAMYSTLALHKHWTEKNIVWTNGIILNNICKFLYFLPGCMSDLSKAPHPCKIQLEQRAQWWHACNGLLDPGQLHTHIGSHLSHHLRSNLHQPYKWQSFSSQPKLMMSHTLNGHAQQSAHTECTWKNGATLAYWLYPIVYSSSVTELIEILYIWIKEFVENAQHLQNIIPQFKDSSDQPWPILTKTNLLFETGHFVHNSPSVYI